MASIQRHGKGYRIKVRRGGRSGTTEYHTGYATLGKAEIALRRIEAQLQAAKPAVYGKRMTLVELLERYAASRAAGPRPNDPYTTRLTVERLQGHCDRQKWTAPEDITPQAIEAWRAGTPRSVRASSLLRVLLRYARDVHGQEVHPQAIPLLAPQRRVRTQAKDLLAEERVAALQLRADHLHASLGALVHCLTTYGWRPITAAKLQVRDVLADGQIRCQVKGGHVVLHPLLPATVELLRGLVKGQPPGAPLFIDPWTGRGWLTHGRGAIPNRLKRRLKVNSYDLKRWACTRLLDAMPVHLARVFTGHLSDTQLQRYARTNEERNRAAIEAMQKMGHPGTPEAHTAPSPPKAAQRKAR